MLQEPNAAHPLGTDDLGRDMLSRLIYGAPVSLYACFLAVAVGLVLGVPIGLCAGYLRRQDRRRDQPHHRDAAVVSRASCWRLASPARSASASSTR